MAAVKKKGKVKSLVIVESPGKIKTISKFLGEDYIIKASFGHVRDLPSKELGVDLENNFAPKYITLRDKTRVLRELRKIAKKCDKLYLAPDPDREGEAIAWHLAEALKFDPEKTFRVTFTEITKKGIETGFQNAHKLNEDLIYAQQARRILDRIVGYKLSPLLWKKVAKGLSGGRVQSVAVRVICEREKEIEKFVKEEYWKITATFKQESNGDHPFDAPLVEWKTKPFESYNKADTDKIVSALNDKKFVIEKIEKKTQSNRPAPPFITSTLQQVSSTQLKYSAKNTMRISQQLYEGVEMGAEGSVSLITYMRTDSFNLSDEARIRAKEYLSINLGEEYIPETPNVYKAKKNAQEAHEAIRPTDCMITPEKAKKYLSNDQVKLYDIIWKRFIASQMAPSKVAITNAAIKAGEGVFKAQGRVILFDGFLKIYNLLSSETDEKKQLLPELNEKDNLDLINLSPTQHFTQPPPRFSEASLVKLLEKEEIGRPATYATILSTIQDRGYVDLESRRFHASELGILVNYKLVEFFPSILDLHFTAEMEAELDKIAEGSSNWCTVIENFYASFDKDLEYALEKMPSEKNKQDEKIACEECSAAMVIRWSKKGKFLGCSAYPRCKYTQSINDTNEEIGKDLNEPCQNCGSPMILKMGRKGKFAACSAYPDCKTTLPINENNEVLKFDLSQEKCDKCDSEMILRMGRRGPFISCSAYPKCKNAKPLPKSLLNQKKKQEEEKEIYDEEVDDQEYDEQPAETST